MTDMANGDCRLIHHTLFLFTTITLICLSIPLPVAVLIPGNITFQKLSEQYYLARASFARGNFEFETVFVSPSSNALQCWHPWPLLICIVLFLCCICICVVLCLYLFHLPMLASLALADSSTAAWSCRTFHPKYKTFLQHQSRIKDQEALGHIYQKIFTSCLQTDTDTATD